MNVQTGNTFGYIINVTLFQQSVGSDCIDVFLEETLNCGVLDSGCPDNICGSDWSNHALDSLDHIKHKEVVRTKSYRTFEFGGDLYEIG